MHTDAITFHEYSLNPTEHPSLSDLKSIGAKEQELWVGEAGGTAGGGHPAVTDSYASGLWWLASLGEHALGGVSVFCRQDLVGGNYGLLNDVSAAAAFASSRRSLSQKVAAQDFPWDLPLNTSADALRAVVPLPDFWTALMWKKLMGTKVLRATASVGSVHVYVHCSQRTPGGVSAVVINKATGNASLTLGKELSGPRDEYVLSAVSHTTTAGIRDEQLSIPATGAGIRSNNPTRVDRWLERHTASR